MTYTANSSLNVRGSTIVVHRVRLQLNLSFEEYCLADALMNMRDKDPFRIITTGDLFKATGIAIDALSPMITELIEKGILIRGTNKKVNTSTKWNTYFNIDTDFDNPDKKDPGFWQIFKQRGNKAMAMTQYKKARKIVDKDTLHAAARKYISKIDDFTFIMHAQKYLNPKNAHWLDNLDTEDDDTETNNRYEGSYK